MEKSCRPDITQWSHLHSVWTQDSNLSEISFTLFLLGLCAWVDKRESDSCLSIFLCLSSLSQPIFLFVFAHIYWSDQLPTWQVITQEERKFSVDWSFLDERFLRKSNIMLIIAQKGPFKLYQNSHTSTSVCIFFHQDPQIIAFKVRENVKKTSMSKKDFFFWISPRFRFNGFILVP